ncbi:TrkA C-terminal domain-containing protein [Neobacillus sp. OS1-2]|uniref:TrkA C-terminal domain-containing protein n=1 Tax=Neobacillus sp. OS1-2 TaxID=3070680 RepID=UPI0027E06E32|nr:TrkA C-terminal domain-containing protein [Neobacillus sp. OS1-2]WML41624.1 TrkA C-terminal domain-containing protein [Neobacillus sp. OS1-2]
MLLFLLIYSVIVWAVIEIFVILFRLTGLKVEVSRFQVISMMTGTGFTTAESELILGHPIRRRLGSFLILFGALSLAVIISSISQFLSSGLRTKEILLAAAATVAVFGLLKLDSVQRLLARVFAGKLSRKIELADLPIRDVFLKNKEDTLLNLHIYQDSELANRTLSGVLVNHVELEIIVLFIQRGKVRIIKNIYDTTIQEGDQLLLFGVEKAILALFAHDIQLMEEKL